MLWNNRPQFGQNTTEVMDVKKEKLSTFFKGKGFYAALAVGAVSLFAVGIINSNIISNDNNNVTENPSTQIAENVQQGEDTEENTNVVNENSGLSQNDGNNSGTIADTQEQKENVMTEQGKNGEQNSEISDLVEPEAEDLTAKEEEGLQSELAAEELVAEVLSPESQISNLVFNEEEGLVWPVQGEILLGYSMEKPIFFKTLAQYKCNSALVIEANEGTQVYSAAKAVITDIATTDETGITITAAIGNEYELVYGQLTDVQVKVGDTVEKGTLLGTIAAPTKYYVEEGSNLYFKVLEAGEAVNPLLLLN